MLQKEDIKAIEKEMDYKTVKAFLKTLDIIGEKKLSIPKLRAYVEEKSINK